MTCGRSSRTPGIDEVRSRFERWRQIRQGETAILEELWSAAAVARRDGASPRRASIIRRFSFLCRAGRSLLGTRVSRANTATRAAKL